MQGNSNLLNYVTLTCSMVLVWKTSTGKRFPERKPIEESEGNLVIPVRPEPIVYGLSPENGEWVQYYKAIKGYQITPEDFFWKNLHDDKMKKKRKSRPLPGIKGRLAGRGLWGLFFGVSDSEQEDKAKKTRYLIRDKSGKDEHFVMNRHPTAKDDNWKSYGPLILFIHGFNLDVYGDAMSLLKTQQMFDLSKTFSKYNSSYNIIVVDWFEAATYHISEYFNAAAGTKFVGEDVGRFLIRLKEVNMITDWEQVHLVGYSLGGHVAGVAGQYVKQNGGGSVGRVTGLDPAGPLFENDGKMLDNTYECLDSSDATFVDVIHCNMMESSDGIVGRLGSRIQSGHADFYPNGGVTQDKYCTTGYQNAAGCSHAMCPKFYINSMTNTEVLACSCDSWRKFVNNECGCNQGNDDGVKLVKFGVAVPSSASGKYYLQL